MLTRRHEMTDLAEDLHDDLRALVGTVIAERYRVDSLLGVGGMGAVFRGHHMGLRRDVAIKVLHPELTRDAQLTARFDREAQSASRLDHPNCLQVTDYGSTPEGMKFMVMQLLEGSELGAMLGAPLEPERAAELMLQIFRGLEHAHEQGVIHRDLKPENVFVTKDHEGAETLKLVDFGIAKIVSGEGDAQESMTRVGLVFGTPQYMSPEQATGIEIDARTDLYSAGIMFYEMLTGKPPFVSTDPVALVRMQVAADPAPLPESIPESMRVIVGKLLAKQRTERFESARAARDALEAAYYEFAASKHGPLWLLNTALGLPLKVVKGMPGAIRHVPGALKNVPEALWHMPGALLEMPERILRRPRRQRAWILGGLAVLALAATGGWFAWQSRADAAAVAAGVPATLVPVTEDGRVDEAARSGPGPERFTEIDRLLLAGRYDEADKLLQLLGDEFPESAQVLWRQARVLAEHRKKKPQALAAYGDAIERDRALLEDKHFYAELLELMSDPKVEAEALNLALRRMGPHGHKFLLTQVNRDKRALDYQNRHRALDELGTNQENTPLIDRRLNTALDLWQASQSFTPCQSYLAGIEEVERDPDPYFLNAVEKAPVPTAATPPSDAEQKACAEIPARRDPLLLKLQAEAAAAPSAGGSGGEAAPAEGKTTSKSRKSRKSRSKSEPKPKSNCAKFGAALFDPNCR